MWSDALMRSSGVRILRSRGLFFGNTTISNRRLESLDPLPHHVQPGTPERRRAKIDAESLSEFGGGRHAGAREQILIFGDEPVRTPAVDGEQAEAEQQAEGVRVVVERGAARVVVRLDGPHVGMIRLWLQAVPIRAGLGIPHLLAELLGGEVPRAAALENALL